MENFTDFNFKNSILCNESFYYPTTLTFYNNKKELRNKILNIILDKENHNFTNKVLTKKEKELIKKTIILKKLKVCTSLVFKNNVLIKYKETLIDNYLIDFLLNETHYNVKQNNSASHKKHRGINKSFSKYMMETDIENFKKEKLIKQKTYDEYFENNEQLSLSTFKKMNRLNKKIDSINFHKKTKLNSLGWKSHKKLHQWQ